MLDLSNLDPWSLPSVSINDVQSLPLVGGVYFGLKDRRVLYIGKAERNLRGRWKNHHRLGQLTRIGGCRVAYLIIDERATIKPIEEELIRLFNPELNRTNVETFDSNELLSDVVVSLNLERLYRLAERSNNQAALDLSEIIRRSSEVGETALSLWVAVRAIDKGCEKLNRRHGTIPTQDWAECSEILQGAGVNVEDLLNKLQLQAVNVSKLTKALSEHYQLKAKAS